MMKTALVVLILTLAVVARHVNCDCPNPCSTDEKCVEVSADGVKQCMPLRHADQDCVVTQPTACSLFGDGICRMFSPCRYGLTCQSPNSLNLWSANSVYYKGTCQPSA